MYSCMRTWKTSVNSFACNLDRAARILAEFLTLEYPLNKNKCGAVAKDLSIAIAIQGCRCRGCVADRYSPLNRRSPLPNCDIIFSTLRRTYRAPPQIHDFDCSWLRTCYELEHGVDRSCS